jgi:hypothetical protein
VAAALAALLLLFARDPAAGGFPSCVFLSLTGWECPGCGSLRATHQLLHGRLLQSLALNPFVLVSSPILAGFLLSELAVVMGRGIRPGYLPPGPLVRLLPVALGLFWVLRNLR